MIIQPNTDLNFVCNVDTEFAGLWSYKDKQSTSSVQNRSGFVISLGVAPVVWVSQF